MVGLELPRILGISVVAGDPMSIAALRGDAARRAGATELPAAGADRSGDLLMNVNGSRFHLLLGEADWGRCFAPLATARGAGSETGGRARPPTRPHSPVPAMRSPRRRSPGTRGATNCACPPS